MAGGEDASPTSLLDLPLPTRITMSLTTTPTSRFGSGMMRDKFCHSCFEITAHTVLAQFGHFTLKTNVRFQKGGRGVQRSNPPSPGAPLTKIYTIIYPSSQTLLLLATKSLGLF